MPLFRDLEHRVLGPLVVGAVMRAIERDGALPYPPDGPGAEVPGPEPLRLHLVGGGIVRGVGLASNELGIAANLARHLSAERARGVIVDAWAEPRADLARMTAGLHSLEAGRPAPDARVALVGLAEALRLRPPARWARDLALLEPFLGPADPPLVLVAAPRLPADLVGPRVLLARIRRSIDELNAVLAERFGAHPSVTLVGAISGGLSSSIGSADDYRRAAGVIVDGVREALRF